MPKTARGATSERRDVIGVGGERGEWAEMRMDDSFAMIKLPRLERAMMRAF